MDVPKLLRTAQSYFPAVKPAKDLFYRHARRLARIPHEHDFRVLRRLVGTADEVLVDVGANHGQTIESIRLFRPETSIVSFEANPRLAAVLTQRYADVPAVRIEQCGLSDSAGRFTLNIPSYHGFVYDGLASLDRNEATSWLGPDTIYGFKPEALEVEAVSCRVAALDDFDLMPSFVKIDVQGMEYSVLRGGRRTLERHRPAVLIEDFETDARINELMTELGYRVCHVAEGRVVSGLGPGPNTLLVPEDRERFD